MQVKLDALELNKTWELVPRAKGKKPSVKKWVYKLKHKANGEVRDTKLDK